MEAEPACQLLPWDSEFFGLRIARVSAARLDAAAAERVAHFARAEHIDCLYHLADADDPAGAGRAEALGFRLADVRLTVSRPLSGQGLSLPPAPEGVRRARPGDLPALRAIARVSHRDSRFYADPHFPDERCDALYESWIESQVQGDDRVVWVAVDAPEGRPVGYLSTLLRADGAGQLDLLAVAPAARGGGRGAALTAAALRWFAEEKQERAMLVTQGRNVNALRHFGSFGFRAERIQLWFHWWPRAGPPAAPDRR